MSMAKVSKKIVGQVQDRMDHCYRCGGLMIREKVLEIGSFDWHCVSCGERIDPVILTHRQAQGLKDFSCEEAEGTFTGKGNARFN